MEHIIKTLKDQRHIDLVKKIFESKQEHVLKFWHELDEIKRIDHLNELSEIDFDLLEKLIENHIRKPFIDKKEREILPVPTITIPKNEEQRIEREIAKKLGETAISNNEVAVFVVAGGQGSRLGYEGPKGKFPISTVKNKTLFQIQAEKIFALKKRYNCNLPWFIMTSDENDHETKKYFMENDYFGLGKENIIIFRQGMFPAIDSNGKLIMKEKHKLFRNPNGHGGSILALYISGAVKKMKESGVKYLFYYQVDNPLVVMADPVFIGYHILKNAEMSAKYVSKAFPEEKVGVYGYVNGKVSVVEYSDLTKEEMYAKDSEGNYLFNAGNIAIHVFNIDFIEKENEKGLKLPFHVAKKKIDTHQGPIDGIKFETFVFDALSDTKSRAIMEVVREEEFAPVKNKDGVDSAASSKEMMNNYYATWLEECGVIVPRKEGKVLGNIEISPIFALGKEEFKKKFKGHSSLEKEFELYIE